MPVLLYTLLRLLLVVGVGAALYFLAGMRGLLLVGVSILIGALLSYILLDKQRQGAAASLQGLASRRPKERRRDVDAEAEDTALDLDGLPDLPEVPRAGRAVAPSAQRERDREGEPDS